MEKKKFLKGSTYSIHRKRDWKGSIVKVFESDIFSNINYDLFSHVIILIADSLLEKPRCSWLAFERLTRQLSNLISMYGGKSDTLYLAWSAEPWVQRKKDRGRDKNEGGGKNICNPFQRTLLGEERSCWVCSSWLSVINQLCIVFWGSSWVLGRVTQCLSMQDRFWLFCFNIWTTRSSHQDSLPCVPSHRLWLCGSRLA